MDVYNINDVMVGAGIYSTSVSVYIMKNQFTLTDSAANQISEVLVDGGNYVRAYIQGGGCSGFNYGFSIEDVKDDGDFVIGQLIIDPISMPYFEGATLDYISDRLKGSQFTIHNPNAKSTCGCGSSFAV